MAGKLKFRKSSKRAIYHHSVTKNGKDVGFIDRNGGYTNFCYCDTNLQSENLREIANKMDSLEENSNSHRLLAEPYHHQCKGCIDYNKRKLPANQSKCVVCSRFYSDQYRK